jgi:hypothetical protein
MTKSMTVGELREAIALMSPELEVSVRVLGEDGDLMIGGLFTVGIEPRRDGRVLQLDAMTYSEEKAAQIDADLDGITLSKVRACQVATELTAESKAAIEDIVQAATIQAVTPDDLETWSKMTDPTQIDYRLLYESARHALGHALDNNAELSLRNAKISMELVDMDLVLRQLKAKASITCMEQGRLCESSLCGHTEEDCPPCHVHTFVNDVCRTCGARDD